MSSSILTYSQAEQDRFVVLMLKERRNGRFLEIGANHPIVNNNTYLLENQYSWSGLMIEYDQSFENLYKLHRPNSIYDFNDARHVNYRELLDSNNFPYDIDYLQIDLDVDNRSTLDTLELLERTVFDKYRFATVTFEHDIYRGNYFDTQKRSREIFKNNGYRLAFPDVKVFWEADNRSFEDWYVHPDLVDTDCDSSESLSHSEIIDKISKAICNKYFETISHK